MSLRKNTPEGSRARHGKPSDAYRASLHKAGKADYTKLLAAVLRVLIDESIDFEVAFNYTLKFPADFPKGLLLRREGLVNVRKLRADRVLRWLNSKGHTDITIETIRRAKISFTAFEKRLELEV